MQQRMIGVLGGAEYIEVWRWDHSTLLSVLFNEDSSVLATDTLKLVSASPYSLVGNYSRLKWTMIAIILESPTTRSKLSIS